LKPCNIESNLAVEKSDSYLKLAGSMKIARKELGSIGEDLAERCLSLDKYKILRRNFRTRFGEIDIIACKDGMLFFFEVKTRKSDSFGFAEEAVNRLKKIRIVNTAFRFINENQSFRHMDMSFLLIAIQAGGGDVSVKMVPMN